MTPDNGTSLQTYFTFRCTGWKDDDGTVEKYSFFSSLYGSEIDSGIGSSKNGELRVQLPQGAEEDEYRMSIYVQVIDNDDGSAYYWFDNPLTVEPNTSFTDMLFDAMAEGADSPEVATLFAGTPQEVTQNLLALSAALNSMSKAANVSRNGKDQASTVLQESTAFMYSDL